MPTGNITSDLPNYGEKIIKASVNHHSRLVLEIIRSHSTTLSIKQRHAFQRKSGTSRAREEPTISPGALSNNTLDSTPQQENVDSAEAKSSKSLNIEEPICSTRGQRLSLPVAID